MGGGDSKLNRTVYHWQRVTNHNGVEIYKRAEDNTLAQKRSIFLDSTHSFETEDTIYHYRKDNRQGLVRVYEVEFLQENIQPKKKKQAMSDICKCTENMNINVYSERIEYRLSELPQLTFAESIQFLKQTLLSFQIVYHKMGPLHINAELIGINDLGEIKVWVNQNWALNHPSHLIHTLKSTNVRTEDYDMVPPELRDESQMIKNLVTVIEDKTQQGRFPNDFGQQIRQKTGSFRETRKFMNQFPTQEYNSYIPAIIKRNLVTINRNKSNLFPNAVPVGFANHNNSIDLQPTNTKIQINGLNPQQYNTSHQTRITTNAIPSRPINIKINAPPVSTISAPPLSTINTYPVSTINVPHLSTISVPPRSTISAPPLSTITTVANPLPLNNHNITVKTPYTSTNTIKFNHSNHSTQQNHNPNATFYFGKEKQPTTVIPLDYTTHVHLDTHNYNPSYSKSLLDPLPNYQHNISSSPLTFKQFQPSFSKYMDTYKPYNSPYSSSLLHDQTITNGSQISKLFPELKFNNLLGSNNNYLPTSNQFPINNTGVQQVKSSLEAPASPLNSLNSLVNKDFVQEHQATYKINPQIDKLHGHNEPALTTLQT